jgi:predicted amidohydrolase
MTTIVAVAQIDPQLGAVEANVERAVRALEAAAEAGADLVVLPECALSGYMMRDPTEALAAACALDGRAVATLVDTCSRLGLHAVTGLLERAADGVYNTAVLTGPDGIVGS